MITKSGKGEKTKELIFSTAISLFQELGYEATTMRRIAEQSGVALGNAYYYFQSKEHLVLALYEKTLELQLESCQPILRSNKTMKRRLARVLEAQLEALKPYRTVLRSLFRFGANPDSPLSPFGQESASIRGRSQQLFKSIIEGGIEKVSPDLADALPFCLWLYHMGIVFFWLHDASQNQRKTARLIGLTSGLLVDFIHLTSMPILKPFRIELLKLIQEFRLNDAPRVEAI